MKVINSSLLLGMIVGVIYLLLFMWWETGRSPMELVEEIEYLINQPFEVIARTLR